jgi:hypothetical protein
MKRISYFIVNIFILFFSSISWSQEWVEMYNSTRSLGMGGAGVAVTSDETALFRNPANLGSVRDFYGTALDPEIEGSQTFISKSGYGSGVSNDIATVAGFLTALPSTYYSTKQQVTPSVVRRNFGLGLIYRTQMHAEVNSAATTMNTFYQSDAGVVLGANYRPFDGIVKIGVNAKLINRIEVINAALPIAGPFTMSTIASEGTAISYDAALMMQFPVKLIPSLGVVVHDVGDTKFNYKDGVRLTATSEPATLKQSVDAAISIFPIHSNTTRSTWTLEYSDIANSRNDNDTMKRVHFGFETNYRDVLFFRGGVNQRYWTAGFEVASERISWQVASYGEEVGTTVAGVITPKEDRRVSMKVSVRF